MEFLPCSTQINADKAAASLLNPQPMQLMQPWAKVGQKRQQAETGRQTSAVSHRKPPRGSRWRSGPRSKARPLQRPAQQRVEAAGAAPGGGSGSGARLPLAAPSPGWELPSPCRFLSAQPGLISRGDVPRLIAPLCGAIQRNTALLCFHAYGVFAVRDFFSFINWREGHSPNPLSPSSLGSSAHIIPRGQIISISHHSQSMGVLRSLGYLSTPGREIKKMGEDNDIKRKTTI